jgi:hypothetical protein
MAEPDIKTIATSAMQCLRDGIRQPLTSMAKAINRLLPLKQLIDVADDGSISISIDADDLTAPGNVTSPSSVTMTTQVINSFYIEGILEGDLARDDITTIKLIDPTTDLEYSPTIRVPVSGFFVPVDKLGADGSRVGAHWNGVTWRVIVTDKCLVEL